MNFSLPKEISFSKEKLQDCQAYVFRHDEVGEIGRIILQELTNGHTHISSEVSGDENDPMTETRKAIFVPISEQITDIMEVVLGKGSMGYSDRVDTPESPKATQQEVEMKLIPCEKCGANVALLIFADNATEVGYIDDYARKLYPKYAELNALTWIIGPSIGELHGPKSPTNIMKVWPDRKPIETTTADEFNEKLDLLLSNHC